MRRASTATGSRGFFRGFAPGHAELLRIPMQKDARWAYYGQQLERLRGVTAAFAVSDHYAIDLMSFLRGQGIAVPEEISVAGFDDTPVCEMVSPAPDHGPAGRRSPGADRHGKAAGAAGGPDGWGGGHPAGHACGAGQHADTEISILHKSNILFFVESYALNLCVPHIRSLQ